MKKVVRILAVTLLVWGVLALGLLYRWNRTLLEQKPYDTEAEEVACYIERHYLPDDTLRAGDLTARYPDPSDMVASLGDPYSELLLREDLDRAVAELNGAYVGVGFEARKKPGEYLRILGITKDSPAMEAGLRPEDVILEIDGRDTRDMDSAGTLSRIRGEEGTRVELTLRRQDRTFAVSLERARLQTPVVQWRRLSDSVGYLALSQIPMLIHQEVESILASMEERSLILDLRGNGGGEIEEVAMLASLLLPDQKLFTVTRKTGEPTVYERTRKQRFSGPMYVLVDGYTASSAELLAQVLRDLGGALLIGEQTFGKGLSQGFFYLESGNILKLTTGSFQAWGGGEIQDRGLVPDVEIPMDPRTDTEDIQLEAALAWAQP